MIRFVIWPTITLAIRRVNDRLALYRTYRRRVAELDRYWANYRAEVAGLIAAAQARGVTVQQAAADADAAAALAAPQPINGGFGLLDPVVKFIMQIAKTMRGWFRALRKALRSRAQARARRALENQQQEDGWDRLDPFMSESQVSPSFGPVS